jgi:hypothetical protein
VGDGGSEKEVLQIAHLWSEHDEAGRMINLHRCSVTDFNLRALTRTDAAADIIFVLFFFFLCVDRFDPLECTDDCI